MAGFVFDQISRSGETVTLGVRVSDKRDLTYCSELVEAYGWQPHQNQKDASFLFSLRRGSSERGRRHFHLLYEGSNLYCRTLDAKEVDSALEASLVERVATIEGDPLCFKGRIVGNTSHLFLDLDEQPEHSLPVVKKFGRLTITKEGALRNRPRGPLKGILVPERLTDLRSPAILFGHLRAHCISELDYASDLLRELISRVPMVTLSELKDSINN